MKLDKIQDGTWERVCFVTKNETHIHGRPCSHDLNFNDLKALTVCPTLVPHQPVSFGLVGQSLSPLHAHSPRNDTNVV